MRLFIHCVFSALAAVSEYTEICLHVHMHFLLGLSGLREGSINSHEVARKCIMARH